MDTTTSELAVQCPRCHTLLYRHAELGWLTLTSGHRHDAAACARMCALLRAVEEPWQDIDL